MHLSYRDEQEGVAIHFVYSSYNEMVGSLHVLYKPEHHLSREEWAKHMLDKMSPSMKEQLKKYGDSLDGFISLGTFMRDHKLWDMSISECLAHIEAMPNERLMLSLYVRKGLSNEMVLGALQQGYYHESIPKAYMDNIKRSVSFQKELIDFLRTYYEEYFTQDISFAEPLLIRKLRREHVRCQQVGIYDYINGLHPRIEVTDKKINFHKYKLFEAFRKNIQEIQLTIDSYHIPHLLIGLYNESSIISLIIPAYITTYDSHKMPEDTLGILKAIADDTRMKIIKYLYSRPMSTQGLADCLNLTEACISKHLKILYRAGIVTKVRDGNYMQYHLNINVIDSLVIHIYEYIN